MEAGANRSRRAAGDVAGNFAAWIAGSVVSLVYVAVSSRIFDPGVVGAYAAGVLAETLVWLAVGSGLPAAVQRLPQGSTGAFREHCGRAILAGPVAAAILLLGAGPWAELWDSPRAKDLTMMFALVALFHPLAHVLLGVLRVEGRHRTAASANAAAGVGSSLLGLVPVLITRDPLSLVASNALVWLLTIVAVAAAGGWVAPRIPRRGGGDRFASRSVLLNLANFAIQNSMAWGVSRYISVATLGLYSRTWLLADLPAQGAASSIVQALFPTMARSGEREGIRPWTDVLVVTAATCGLLLGAIAALSSVIVIVLLGDAWIDAIPLLSVLAVSLSAMAPQWVLSSQLQAGARFRPLAASRIACLPLAAGSVALVAVTHEPLLAAALAGVLQIVLHVLDLRSAAALDLVGLRSLARGYRSAALACLPLWALAAVQASAAIEPRGLAGLSALSAVALVAVMASAAIMLRGRVGTILATRELLPARLVGLAGSQGGFS